MSQEHERPWLEGAKAAVGETSQQVDPIAPTPAVTTQPDASELPKGAVTLADALRELAAILPGLKSRHRTPPGGAAGPPNRRGIRLPRDDSPRHRENGAPVDSLRLTCTSARPPSGNPKLCAIGSIPGRGEAGEHSRL